MSFYLAPREFLSAPLPALPRLLTALSEWGAILIVACFLPLRFSKKATVFLLPLLLLGQVLLRSFGSYDRGDAQMYFWFSIGMTVNLCYMYLCLLLLSKGRTSSLFFYWALAFLMAETSSSLGWQVARLLEKPSLGSPSGAFLSLFPMGLVLAGCYFILHEYKEVLPSFQGPSLTILAVLISTLTFLASNVNVLRSPLWKKLSLDVIYYMVGLIRTLVDLGGLLSFYLLLKSLKEKQMERGMAALNRVMELQYQQYLEFREMTSYVSGQYHDLKHQVAALRTCLSPEEVAHYLDGLEETLNHYGLYCDTGNAVLDTILLQKLLYCRQHGISLGYDCQGSSLFCLRTQDLCSLFGNLLDNAIEHVLTFPEEEERQILIEVGERQRFLFIRVENRSYLNLVPSPTLPETSKEDRENHGIGGKFLSSTIKSYHGTMKVMAKDGWFTVSILIPMDEVNT